MLTLRDAPCRYIATRYALLVAQFLASQRLARFEVCSAARRDDAGILEVFRANFLRSNCVTTRTDADRAKDGSILLDHATRPLDGHRRAWHTQNVRNFLSRQTLKRKSVALDSAQRETIGTRERTRRSNQATKIILAIFTAGSAMGYGATAIGQVEPTDDSSATFRYHAPEACPSRTDLTRQVDVDNARFAIRIETTADGHYRAHFRSEDGTLSRVLEDADCVTLVEAIATLIRWHGREHGALSGSNAPQDDKTKRQAPLSEPKRDPPASTKKTAARTPIAFSNFVGARGGMDFFELPGISGALGAFYGIGVDWLWLVIDFNALLPVEDRSVADVAVRFYSIGGGLRLCGRWTLGSAWQFALCSQSQWSAVVAEPQSLSGAATGTLQSGSAATWNIGGNVGLSYLAGPLSMGIEIQPFINLSRPRFEFENVGRVHEVSTGGLRIYFTVAYHWDDRKKSH